MPAPMLRRSKGKPLSVILILIALVLLIAGAWAGVSVLVLAPLLAALATLAAGLPVLAAHEGREATVAERLALAGRQARQVAGLGARQVSWEIRGVARSVA